MANHDYKLGESVFHTGLKARVVAHEGPDKLWIGYEDRRGLSLVLPENLIRAADETAIHEVVMLVNKLASAGCENPALMAKQAAQLLVGRKGKLTYSEKIQAAALLIASAWYENPGEDEASD